MKPAERFAASDPREWLNRARSSLAIARNRVPDAYLEDLCFEAQQAAEKAIKALMIRRGIDFPHVHDLARLLSMLEGRGETIPDSVRQAGGHANALRMLILDEQERAPDFLRLSNALSALYPRGSREKRLLDAMLLAVPK